MRYTLEHFIVDLDRLLAGSLTLDSQAPFVGALDRLAPELFTGPNAPGCWYDGIIVETSQQRKAGQWEITGRIWTVDGSGTQTERPVQIHLTDQRITQQGIRIGMRIGTQEAEGEIAALWPS